MELESNFLYKKFSGTVIPQTVMAETSGQYLNCAKYNIWFFSVSGRHYSHIKILPILLHIKKNVCSFEQTWCAQCYWMRTFWASYKWMANWNFIYSHLVLLSNHQQLHKAFVLCNLHFKMFDKRHLHNQWIFLVI